MPKGAKSVGDRDAIAAMQHCSFTTSKAQFDVLHQRLKDEGLSLIGPVNVGAQTWSLYFFDPNGIRLELSWQEHDGDDVQVVKRWTQTQAEALEELKTLSQDPKWLTTVTSHLPAAR
jgi:hypothetical protein